MQNGNRSKRIISVRTPVVLYEDQLNGTENQAVQVDGVKEILKQVDISAINPKQIRSYENVKTVETATVHKAKQSKSFDGAEFLERTRGRRVLTNQQFLAFNKFHSESPLGISCKGNYYQDILDRIASRIKKLKTNQVINLKNKEERDRGKTEFFQMSNNFQQHQLLPKTRKRFRSVNANRNRVHYVIA
jgi:hypothetical protein